MSTIDQSYCAPRRSIVDNISLIHDALEVSKLLNLNFGLIPLEQEKAFDQVEHFYLWKKIKGSLEKWKFLLSGMSYRGHILVIYNLVASSMWHKLACLEPILIRLSFFNEFEIYFNSRREPNDERLCFWSVCD